MIYVQASAIWQVDNCANDCALWVAGYPSWTGDNWQPDHEDMPYDIGAFNDWAVWQYTSDGGTDRNVANITVEQWQQLAGYTKPEPAPRCADVWLYEANGSDAQKWHPHWDAEGKWFMLENIASGLYLDVKDAKGESGQPVWAYTRNESEAQWFRLAEVTSKEYNPKFVRPVAIIPRINQALRVDVQWGQFKTKTPIQLWPLNDSNAQCWSLADDGKGIWQFFAVEGAYALDVKHAGN